MLLIGESSLKAYLRKELDKTGQALPLSLNVKAYLVDMLCHYMSSDRLFAKRRGESRASEITLLDLYKKSQSAGSQEKLRLFKTMGDFSLYFSGFFRSRVKKKIVPVSYYEWMGQTAYNFVGEACGSQNNVFKELAFQFKNLSQILFSLYKRSENKNPSYLLKSQNPTKPGAGEDPMSSFH